jgi:glutaminyl-peptide cyclotransferase
VAAPATDPQEFSGVRALEEVTRLAALGPRETGTAQAGEAARYLAERVRARGVRAEVDEFADGGPSGAITVRNVIGRVPGSTGGLIVLGAHFDTKAGLDPGYQGVNDSCSGAGVLLELAGVLGRAPGTGPEILLAFLDGEECRRSYGPRDGLHGSRRLAGRLVARGDASRIRAVIILDMVGDRDLTVTLPRNGTPALMSLALEAAREEGRRDRFFLLDGAVLDDHVPFLEAGLPAVDLIDFQFGPTPGSHAYWHAVDDTLDKLDARSLETVGRVVIRMLNRLR